MNKSYFRFLVRYHRVPLIFFFVFYMTIAMSFFMMRSSYQDIGYWLNTALSNTVNVCMIMSILLSFGIPVYLFSWMHKKRSCDVYGALPFTRKEELVTSLVAGFLVCFGYFLLGTIIPAIIGAVRGELYLSGYLLTVAAMALGSAVLLMINTGIYLIANNALDGVVMLGAYHFLPAMVMITVGNVFSNIVAGINSPDMTVISWLSPVYAAGSLVTDTFSKALRANLNIIGLDPLWPRVLILIGVLVLSIVLLKANFVERRLERAEQLSDNALAYPLVIRIYTALCLLILASGMFRDRVEFVMFILIFAAFLVSQFVYRRTIRPNWKMIVQFLILVAGAFAIIAIGWWTKGFSLAERPVDYVHARSIQYMAKNYEDEATVDLTLDLKLSAKDTEAINLLEQARKNSIDAFYRRKPDSEDSLSNWRSYCYMLSIETSGASYTYPLYSSNAFSADDLKLLQKYGTLTIQKYSYVEGDTQDLTLEQYRQETGN